jgi:hypothetical protein
VTAQISDTVVYRRRSYSATGVKGTGQFEPSLHGLRPVAISPACWRRYYCRYSVLPHGVPSRLEVREAKEA